ncbi:MAG TPA: SPFH domain-containing protein [Roseiflexaceae bacterium]|nr:SPFH domain-containing protein [Roseiflexaceae bacterium]HMP41291.1 SPFH domain-containing protein [Roseiflexaceae bacterium]
MATKYLAASLVLTLMFFSLVAIYLVVPQSDLVTFLCVVIMAVGLIIALNGDWNEIGMMALFAAIVSLVASYFVGRYWIGGPGGLILPLLWFGVLAYLTRWISDNTVPVPEDQAVLVTQFFSGKLSRLMPPIAPPLIPFLERRVATIPLYEISQDVDVEKINTIGGDLAKAVIAVHYGVDRERLSDPDRLEFVLGNIPNRGQIQNEVAKEMGYSLDRARLEIDFWERLLKKQMKNAVDNIVRKVVFSHGQNPVNSSKNRADLAPLVFEELKESTRQWGIDLRTIDLEYFEITEDQQRNADPIQREERETKRRELEAQREATHIKVTRAAKAMTDADRVQAIIKALQEAGVIITPDIISAILLPYDPLLENELRALTEASAKPAPPAAQAKNDAPKK